MRQLIFAVLLLIGPVALAASPFTFQGAIDDDGTPLTGAADLSFTVHDQAASGSVLAGPLEFPNHPVADGVFSVTLDFPGLTFDGQPRFVEVTVNGQSMQPRIQIRAAPLAGSTLALLGRAIDPATPQVGDALVWDGSAWAPEAVGGGFSAGAGLNLAGSTFSIAPHYRLPQGCSGDEVVRWSGTQWQCSEDQDADTQYSAGTGLILASETFRVAPDYRLPQGCSGNQIARWSGSQWSCGDDENQDTQYTAGSGLSLAGQAFEVDFAGTGTNDSAARSDHGHFGDRFEGFQFPVGLEIVNTLNASLGVPPTGVSGQAIGAGGIGVFGSGETGVHGESFDVGVSGLTSGDEGGGAGILGMATTNDGEASALMGIAYSPDAQGLSVSNFADSGLAYGAYAYSSSPSGIAISGYAPGDASGTAIGVRGKTQAPFGLGMFATNTASSGPATALLAVNSANGGTASEFRSLGAGAARAVDAWSTGTSTDANAIRARLTATNSTGDAIYASSQSSSGKAGRFVNVSGTAIALAGETSAFEATGNGVISGDLGVFGTLSAAAKFFRIDHPLNPEERYLQHAAIESDEMLTLYSGNVSTDSAGLAEVRLPEWFEALNRDFRYQLTVIDSFARAIVAEEIQDGRFLIRTDAPNVKVSWQVTAERQDAWALANPLDIEPLRSELSAAKFGGNGVSGEQQ